MLLPVPIVIGWFLAVSQYGKINESSLQRLYYFAPWISLSFLIMAATIAVFLRVRQRTLRVGLLAASGMLTLALVVYNSTRRLDIPTFFGLMLVMWGVFLAPPLLERYLTRHHRLLGWKKEKRPA
jgi:uncharacterized membrane protein